MRRVIMTFVAVLLVVSGAAAQDFQKEVPARSGDLLELDLDAGGSVEITGWSSDAVAVSAHLGGRNADNITVMAEATSSGVLVKTDFVERSRSNRSSIDLVIRVPHMYDVKLNSMGGGLSIDGVEGEFSGTTMGGGLTLTNIKGTLDLKTMGGEINLTLSEVEGRVHTMGGKVLVEDVIGDVDAHSMGGPVILRNVTRLDGTSTGDKVVISSMGGEIEVASAPAGADLHTMGGNIEVDSARDFVKAKTMGGDVRLREVDGSVNATTMGGDIEVNIVGSGGDVELESMSGEIHLNVPAGFAMDLEVELEYTKNSRRDYKISGDFKVAELVDRDWDHSKGSPRKTIRGTGSYNGGGNRVHIRTVNGNVVITEGR